MNCFKNAYRVVIACIAVVFWLTTIVILLTHLWGVPRQASPYDGEGSGIRLA